MERYPLLDERYDVNHRARKIEEGQVRSIHPNPLPCLTHTNPSNIVVPLVILQNLGVLRPMTHEARLVMHYDHRYTPLLRRAKLLTVSMIYHRGLPPLNPPAITALVDRWRPETHTFHLPLGEMTVTLEDVAMILGLPIRGAPVTDDAPPGGWVGRVEAFLGRPLPAEQDGKKRRTSGVPLRWIRQEFGQCPEDADEDTINFHCRAWVLNIVFASTG